MSDQIRISDSGELETVPTTWDGEPLYSPSTVAEGLFDADAFKQMPGQTSMSPDETCSCGAEATWHHPRTGEPACGHPACTVYQTLRALDEPDNSPETVAARRAMFSGFGWGLS